MEITDLKFHPGAGLMRVITDEGLEGLCFGVGADTARVIDSTFRSAPTGWRIDGGQWQVQSRWACTPRWAWYGGRSEGLASIWTRDGLEGDVIVEFNEMPIDSYDDLPRRVAATPPGTEVPIVVMRDGKTKELKAVLDAMDQPEVREISAPSPSSEWGFEVEELTEEARESLELDDDTRGVLISGVERGSPASKEGLRRGDVILEANHRAVRSVEDLEEELGEAKDRVLLLVQRGDGTLFVVVTRSS